MARLLWVLPLCMILRGQGNSREAVSLGSSADTPVVNQSPQVILEGRELARQQVLGGLGLFPQAGFPAALPWSPLYEVGARGIFPLESILRYQPVLFLEMCLEKYERDIQGYSFTFSKQERIQGRLQPQEKIRVQFREKPFSVLFDWLEGAGLAKKLYYVEGQHQGLMRVRGKGLLGLVIISKDPEGTEARQTSRYTIKEFGLKLATQRTLTAMRKAQARGTLHVRYEGLVQVAELNNRKCYKFVRTPYEPPEEDGVHELTFYIDQENWLQVGSMLKDSQGNIIAEYYFRDLQVNPPYPKDLFTDKSL